MLNNSITNSKHYSATELNHAVKMLNNLSSELDMLRLTMMETGLETIARNINHKNEHLKLFEFGKTYQFSNNNYTEEDHLALFTTGVIQSASWKNKEVDADLYFLKGVLKSLEQQSGISGLVYTIASDEKYDVLLEGKVNNQLLVRIAKPTDQVLKNFDIKVTVWFADIHWKNWVENSKKHVLRYKEISKFPAVQRDLSFVASNQLTYGEIEKTLSSLSIPQLKGFRLFDVFKSEKLGNNKQSLAMNFTFMDESKTMKDEEIEKMMQKIILQLEKQFQAEIRK
ncbi:MAG: phenylalanine--tRNA ligase subunit beta, partial [Chitinophagaceae bacterium]